MARYEPYRGPLVAAVLDWAGTMVDHGSLAPITALSRAFAARLVPIEPSEARSAMGMAKRDHIAAILALPSVAARFAALAGHPPGEADIDALYADFLPLQDAAVVERAVLIEGALGAVADLRRRGMKIATTTGYPRPMAERLAGLAATHGYRPDCLVCAGDTPQGRPSPLMVYRALGAIAAWPPEACVKVGDTAVDMLEGRNAGLWAVGLSVSGNEVGLDEAEWAALAPAEQQARRRRAEATLTEAGAHAVIGSIAELPAALDAIERRRAAGERP